MEINKIAVIGAGAMGSGIAYWSSFNGFNVSVTEQNDELLKRGMQKIKDNVITGVNKGKITPKQAEEIMAKIKGTVNLAEAVKDADIVIEAVFENMDLKKEVFRKLDASAPKHAVLATNTSALGITEIASVTKRPEKVVGMHFFNPVPAMKLVEIVRGNKTSDETVKIVDDLAHALKKETVTCRDSPGFIVNRILGPILNEAVLLLQEGIASREDIDKAMTLGTNFPMGPLRLADFVGLDVALEVSRTLEKGFGEKFKPPSLLVEKVKRGELGIKTRKGFYEY